MQNPNQIFILSALAFLCFSAEGNAEDAKWALLKDPNKLECVLRPALHVNYDGLVLYAHLMGSPPRARNCAALKLNALENGKSIFLNIDSGDLLVDDGSFELSGASIRENQGEQIVKLSEPAQLECVLRPALHVNYKGQTVFASFAGAIMRQHHCNAVRATALEAKVPVYLNTSTGEMMPEGGLFRHTYAR